MNPSIERLLDLQALDGEIGTLTAERDERPATLKKEQRKVAAATAAFDAAKKVQNEAQVRIDKFTLDIASGSEQVAKYRQSMLAPKIGNKEYQALQNQIASVEADNLLIEEKILEVMEEADELARATNDAKADLTDHEKKLVDAQRRVDEEVGKYDARIDELKGQREGKTVGVGMDIMRRYDRVSTNHPGNAVVPVTDGYCQGCYMNITMHDLTLIVKGEDVKECKSCQRLLYAANPGDFLG